MKELCVNVSDNSISNIYIENGLISKAGKLIKEKFNCKKIALVSDTNVYLIYGDIIKSQLENEGYEVFTYIFKAGEASKNTTERIIKVLEKNNLKISDSHSKKEIISAMSGDKKRTGSGIKFVMIDKIGSSFINPIKYEDINKTFGVD